MADPAIILQDTPLTRAARGIRAQLELAFPVNKFSFAWVPARVTAARWQALTRRTPFIGIGFNRFQKSQTTTELNVISEWSIFLAVKNEAGQEPLFFGDKLAPGQFSLASVAAAVLHGHLLPGLGTVQVEEATNAFIEDFADDALGLTSVEITVPVSLAIGGVLGGGITRPAQLEAQTIIWAFGDTSYTETDTIEGT